MKAMWLFFGLLMVVAVIYQVAPGLGNSLTFWLFVAFVTWLVASLVKNR